MIAKKMGLVAAMALVAGVAGCSLPEVLPLAGGTRQGPSPYGPWYEQHWATNAVLLAASDQPDEGFTPDEEKQISDSLKTDGTPESAAAAEGVQPEASIQHPAENVDFDNSSPYQFPSSEFQQPAAVATPPPAAAPPPPADELTPPTQSSAKTASPSGGGPIRY